MEDLSERRGDAGEPFGQLFLGFPARFDTGGVDDSSRTDDHVGCPEEAAIGEEAGGGGFVELVGGRAGDGSAP
ncbi:hypothetical protein [Streptomyces canus]|uniref:hypothetical protein n=1 Tax=Streptomyces canus TaxID=58343 RepID=UPI0036EFADDD